MREILFRGKAKDSGKWEYGCLQCFKGFSIFSHAIKNFITVKSETIGQYTGLADKNGEMIFEGDIVKTKFNRLCVVVWFSSMVRNGWDLKPIDIYANINDTEPPTLYDMYADYNLEVIGNIYDNPELLETKTSVSLIDGHID